MEEREPEPDRSIRSAKRATQESYLDFFNSLGFVQLTDEPPEIVWSRDDCKIVFRYEHRPRSNAWWRAGVWIRWESGRQCTLSKIERYLQQACGWPLEPSEDQVSHINAYWREESQRTPEWRDEWLIKNLAPELFDNEELTTAALDWGRRSSGRIKKI